MVLDVTGSEPYEKPVQARKAQNGQEDSPALCPKRPVCGTTNRRGILFQVRTLSRQVEPGHACHFENARRPRFASASFERICACSSNGHPLEPFGLEETCKRTVCRQS